MATVTGLTATRMLAIEAASVVSGAVDGTTHHLILTKHDASTIDAGNVQGPVGPGLKTTSGTPSSGTGIDGEMRIDPSTGLIYGPKASGAWPAGVQLTRGMEVVKTRWAATVLGQNFTSTTFADITGANAQFTMPSVGGVDTYMYLPYIYIATYGTAPMVKSLARYSTDGGTNWGTDGSNTLWATVDQYSLRGHTGPAATVEPRAFKTSLPNTDQITIPTGALVQVKFQAAVNANSYYRTVAGCTATNGSPTVTQAGLGISFPVDHGLPVSFTSSPSGAYVKVKNSGTSFDMNANYTGTTASTYSVVIGTAPSWYIPAGPSTFFGANDCRVQGYYT